MVFESLSALAALQKKKTRLLTLPPVPPLSTIAKSCASLFLRNSVFAFNLRFAMALFFQVISLVTSGGKTAVTLTNLFKLNVHEEALRWGVFVGAFSAQHEFLKAALSHCRNGQQDWINSFVAATSAGPWFLVLPENRREWLTLYAPARAISATWSYLVTRHYFRPIDDGSLLFILTSSQIMYAYVMRPESLKESYWKFIINAGPLERDMLGLIKSHHRGVPALEMGAQHGTTPALGKQLHTFLTAPGANTHGGIPCHIMHPGRTCQQQRMYTFRKGFTQAVALYGSLGLTASVAFNLKRVITQPLTTAWYLATSSIRSALFLALFPTLYMSAVCVYKKQTRLALHSSYYFFAGLFGASSILIERTSRKFELAMFALPRALQSLGNIGVANGWIPPYFKTFTMVSFSVSMGVLLTAYDVDRGLLVPAMQSLLGNFFISHKSRPTKLAHRKQERLEWRKNKTISGVYQVDNMKIVLAPRIAECIEYASDEDTMDVESR